MLEITKKLSEKKRSCLQHRHRASRKHILLNSLGLIHLKSKWIKPCRTLQSYKLYSKWHRHSLRRHPCLRTLLHLLQKAKTKHQHPLTALYQSHLHLHLRLLLRSYHTAAAHPCQTINYKMCSATTQTTRFGTFHHPWIGQNGATGTKSRKDRGTHYSKKKRNCFDLCVFLL